MDLGLRGRVALVCAASQGLGKAAASALVAEGAHVVICSRDRKRIAAAGRELRGVARESGAAVVSIAADLTKARDIRKVVAATVKRFGRIDILVTNAGGPPVATFPDLDDALWGRGVELTLLSVIRCIREALPHMRKEHWGRIINITSVAAKQPIGDLVISSTLRPGILGLTKVLANQYGKDGVLVNCVAPGFILTARQKEIGTARAAKGGMSMEEYLDGVAREVPLGRFGRPEELAHVIVFLASERASYINGATISVDGGLVRGLL
jgi:3-oxoacyl-[acyl-carrier protein] reductase